MASEENPAQNTVMATYRLAEGAEQGFLDLLRRHWHVLNDLGMVEPAAPQIYRQQDGDRVTYVEIFTWKPGAAGKAHEHPEVAATWESMGQFVTPHGHKPEWEFPHFSRWTG